MATKIYTKTGDGGATRLLGGTSVLKSDLRIEAYGSLDELNSYIGLCRDLLRHELPACHEQLYKVQDTIFVAGSLLACGSDTGIKMHLPVIDVEQVTILEQLIDKMEAELPALKQFILPGGHPIVSQLHIARCICRRAERNCVRLQQESEVESLVIQYLNRLSDYLFVLARYAAYVLKVDEIPWKGAKG